MITLVSVTNLTLESTVNDAVLLLLFGPMVFIFGSTIALQRRFQIIDKTSESKVNVKYT